MFLLVEIAAQAEAGKLDLAGLVDRRSVDPVADSGLWQHLDADLLSVRDAARLVASVSDNLATNVLLDVVGLDAVQARASTLAPGGTMLLDRVRDVRSPADPPMLSTGCAHDWVEIMLALEAGEVVSPGVSRQVLGWLATSVDHSMVAGALALDPLAPAPDSALGGLRVWNKTGTDDGVRADVGLVTGPRGTVAYAAICAWRPGAMASREVLRDMRQIGCHIADLVGA